MSMADETETRDHDDPAFCRWKSSADRRVRSVFNALFLRRPRLFAGRSSLSILLLCVLSACSPQSDNAAPDMAGSMRTTLNRSTYALPSTFDPHAAIDIPTDEVLRDVFEGLVSETRDGKLAPGAAQTWTVSDDGLVYQFELSPMARWSNGDPLTAHDFVFSLRRAVSPAANSPMASLLSPIANAESINKGIAPIDALGVKAISDQRLEIRLHQPTPYFLTMLTTTIAFPVHERTVDRLNGPDADPAFIVSNGAYYFRGDDGKSLIVLSKNKAYWNAKETSFDTVTYRVIGGSDEEIERFESGALHLTGRLESKQYSELRRRYPNQLVVTPTFGIYCMAFDTTEPPFDDLRLRKALSIAINRDAISLDILQGTSPGAWGFIPPGVNGTSGYTYPWRSLPRDQQIALSKQLYAEAGYSSENPLGIELLYVKANDYRAISEVIAKMLADNLGIEVTLIEKPWSEVLDLRRDYGRWDLIRYGVGGIYRDANTLLEVLRSDSDRNPSGWKSLEYDQLLDQANAELNADERSRLLRDTEAFMMEQYPLMPLHFLVSSRLVSRDILGYHPPFMSRTYSKHLSLKPTSPQTTR